MRARALIMVAVVSGAVLAVSASARVERQVALGPWTGTVTVVENVDYSYPLNSAYTSTAPITTKRFTR